MKKKISILGSTGNIGLSVLKIIDKTDFSINLLSAKKNYKKICFQIKKYKPKYFVVSDIKIYEKLKKKFRKKNTIILNNYFEQPIKFNSHITVAAISGIDGLKPTFFMISKSKKILIANKESIMWMEFNKKNS